MITPQETCSIIHENLFTLPVVFKRLLDLCLLRICTKVCVVSQPAALGYCNIRWKKVVQFLNVVGNRKYFSASGRHQQYTMGNCIRQIVGRRESPANGTRHTKQTTHQFTNIQPTPAPCEYLESPLCRTVQCILFEMSVQYY